MSATETTASPMQVSVFGDHVRFMAARNHSKAGFFSLAGSISFYAVNGETREAMALELERAAAELRKEGA